MSKARNTFDAILASAPLNATAARVTARGEHYDPKLNDAPHIAHWDAPPKMRPTVGLGSGSPEFLDLTGRQFGRLRVLGVLDDTQDGVRKTEKGAKWVVRCTCGDYEVRSRKAILNPNNADDGAGSAATSNTSSAGIVNWVRARCQSSSKPNRACSVQKVTVTSVQRISPRSDQPACSSSKGGVAWHISTIHTSSSQLS